MWHFKSNLRILEDSHEILLITKKRTKKKLWNINLGHRDFLSTIFDCLSKHIFSYSKVWIQKRKTYLHLDMYARHTRKFIVYRLLRMKIVYNTLDDEISTKIVVSEVFSFFPFVLAFGGCSRVTSLRRMFCVHQQIFIMQCESSRKCKWMNCDVTCRRPPLIKKLSGGWWKSLVCHWIYLFFTFVQSTFLIKFLKLLLQESKKFFSSKQRFLKIS